MSRRLPITFAAFAAAVAATAAPLTACVSAELLPPVVRTRKGPSFARRPAKLIALPSTCATLSTFGLAPEADPFADRTIDPYAPAPPPIDPHCTEEASLSVDNRVRAELEFHGYNIVDAERLVAVTRSRVEIIDTNVVAQDVQTRREAMVVGALWEDATPAQQATVLRDLGADGILSTRVWIGASVGLGGRRTTTAQIRLLHAVTGELVWVSRCQVEVGFVLDSEAMESATKCALEGALAL